MDEEMLKELKKIGLKIGNNVHIMSETIIDKSHAFLIEIGNNVTLAHRVYILAHDASTKKELGYTKIGQVKIGNNVFIGAQSIVLPNTKIGNNVIIGAGSVVSKNIPNNSVVAGNPIKFICTYEEYMKKNLHMIKTKKIFSKEYTINNPNLSDKMKQEMIEATQNGICYIL